MTSEEEKMKQFIAKLTAITSITALIGWLVFSFIVPQYYIPVLPWLLLFFFVFTLIIHAYQLNLSKKDFGKFSRSNMLVTFLKLVIYSVFAVVYIANDRENALTFVIALFLIYMVFTFVEVSEITRISKNNKK